MITFEFPASILQTIKQKVEQRALSLEPIPSPVERPLLGPSFLIKDAQSNVEVHWNETDRFVHVVKQTGNSISLPAEAGCDFIWKSICESLRERS